MTTPLREEQDGPRRPPTVGDCVRVLEAAYPPSWAESWDAVGLAVGDPATPVERVLFAVDPTPEVAAEAASSGATLLVTHHPLFLRGTHDVAETNPGGRVVATLIRAGCALYTAHTNADVARPGVSDALAAALGVVDTVPLRPHPAAVEVDKLTVYVPIEDRSRLLDALSAAGAGHIGNYDRCGWWTSGTGTFRPLAGAHPTIGEVARVEEVTEDRLDMVAPRARRRQVVDALRATHPYEEPAFDLVELASVGDQQVGLGRVGELTQAEPLGDFVRRVADVLPRTAWGVRSTGDAHRLVRRVAVCGGSGGELAPSAAAAGADVFVTADGRHHHVLDASLALGSSLALVDAAHWATEHPWLAQAADVLRDGLAELATVNVPRLAVSDQVTDPWRLHAG